jgi:hypothetical protein
MAQNQGPGDQQQQLRGLYAPQYAAFGQQPPAHYIQGAIGPGTQAGHGGTQHQYMMPEQQQYQPQQQQYPPQQYQPQQQHYLPQQQQQFQPQLPLQQYYAPPPPALYYPSQADQLNGPQLQGQGAGQQAAVAAAAASAAQSAASNKRFLGADAVEGSDDSDDEPPRKLSSSKKKPIKADKKAAAGKQPDKEEDLAWKELRKLADTLGLWRGENRSKLGLCVNYPLLKSEMTNLAPDKTQVKQRATNRVRRRRERDVETRRLRLLCTQGELSVLCT